MPLRRGMGGLSSGAGGNLFDRPGFFNVSEIEKLTVDTELLLKAASETYGIKITHADTSGASQDYELEIPALSANAELVTTNHTQTLTNKTITDLRLPALYDSNGNELFKFTATGSAVNELTLANAATSNAPVLSATGGDTNIGITLTPKGSGQVRITGGLQVDGTTTTIDSTTLTVDDKNIELGSVASPSDTTADGGGITLKGATDKTLIWDNANDNWTSNQDWNIASGKAYYVDGVMTLNATVLGANVAASSLTAVGTLSTGAISSGFGNIDIGTSVLTAGQLNIDNIRIDGNTISSISGQILFDATTTLDFGDDSALNIGTLTLDAIHGDNNAIQVGDNSDDAVSIYRVNALTAIGDLDIGAHDFRAATITSDGLTTGRVVFAGTNGVLSDDSDLTFATATLTATNIAAFNLTGKLTAGSTEIEGSAFDINGGTIDGVAIGASTAVTEISVDNLTLNGNTISTTDTNGSMVLAPHGTGDVHLNTDTVQIGDINTLALITTNGTGSIKLNTNAGTNSGHIQINSGANGAIDLTPDGSGDVNITNVDIGSGNIDGTTLGGASAVTISGATIGGSLIWSAAQNLNNQNLTNVDIDSGTINDITTFGIKQSGTAYEMQIAVGTGTDLTADRVLSIDPKNAARAITLTGNLTLAGNFITTGAYATTLTTTGTTGVTLPTTGTLATLAGTETFTNKSLSDSTTYFIDNADTTKRVQFQISAVANSTTRTVIFPNSDGTFVYEALGATLTNKTINASNNTLSNIANAALTNSTITMAASTGTSDAIALGETFTITAGEGIDTTMGTNLVTIAGEDATTSNKGIASFHSDNFAVSSGAVTIKGGGVANAELVNSAITIGGTATSLGGTITALTALTDLDLTAGNKTIFDTVGANTLTIGASGTTVSIAGHLTVAGTTTTVNSTTVTIADPIFNLGGTSVPGSDDNKDRGISFQWHNGSAAKVGFFGFDDSTGKMTFIPDATINSEVVSGTAGNIVATTFEGALSGNASTATALATARTIGGTSFDGTGNIAVALAAVATEATNVTAVANNTENETVYLTFVDGATGTQGVETDTGLTYNPYTGVVTAGSFAGVVTGTAETATALANARTIGMTGDVVWTSASFDGTANVTGASTIQANAVQSAMIHQDVVGDRTELTSGIATDADFLLLWDATDSVLKKVKPDNLGVSGLAVGGSSQIQYASGTTFAGAVNVQILNAGLALKEMSTPSDSTGFGMLYAKGNPGELYYKNDTHNEVKLTLAGAMAGGGAFRGIKAHLSANNTISNDSTTTPSAWTESYDVGGFHVASGGTENRFTFGVTGYYEIKIQQEWAADAAGYREMRVVHFDTSNSNTENTLVRDRMDGSSQATVSGSSTIFYVDDAADYVKVQLFQNSGASLVATGNNDDSTSISITRMDMASSFTAANGAAGRVQFSDGSGGFTSDSDLTFVTDTLTATKLLSTQVGFNKAIVAGAQVAIQNSNDSTLWPLSIYNDNGNQGFYITQDASGNQTIRMKDNAGTVRVQLDTSGTSYINGNVGIGGTPTTLSDTNLSVIGAATAETHIQTTGTDSLAILRLQNDTSTWSMSVRGNDYDKFRIRNDSTSPYDFFTIDEAGFVGIGINSPMSKAHIYEDTSTVVAGAGLTIEQDGAGDAVLQFLLTGTRRFVVGIDNTDDKFKIGEGLDVGNNTFLTIDGSGNVGIGDATPTQLLTIKEQASKSAMVEFVDTDDYLLGYIGAARATDDFVTGTANTDLVIRTTSSGTIHFVDGTTVNMQIAGDGKLKLGGGNVNGYLTTTGTGDLVLDTNNGTTSGNIVIEQGSNQPITITPHGTGGVGINTAAPSDKLAVTQTASAKGIKILSAIAGHTAQLKIESSVANSGNHAQIRFSTNGSGGGDCRIAMDTNQNPIWTFGAKASDNTFRISSNSGINLDTPDLTITAGGDVGIGGGMDIAGAAGITLSNDETITNATNGVVTIDGDFQIKNQSPAIQFTDTNAKDWSIEVNTDVFQIYGNGTSDAGGATKYLEIADGGNMHIIGKVGIGSTPTAGGMLRVQGQAPTSAGHYPTHLYVDGAVSAIANNSDLSGTYFNGITYTGSATRTIDYLDTVFIANPPKTSPTVVTAANHRSALRISISSDITSSPTADNYSDTVGLYIQSAQAAVVPMIVLHSDNLSGYRSAIQFKNNYSIGEHVASSIEGSSYLNFFVSNNSNVANVLSLALASTTGDATFIGDVECVDLTETSDERLKTNVQTLSSALATVSQMRGISYDSLVNGASSVGLIAQELELIAPELVKTGDSENTKTINAETEDEEMITDVKSVNYSKLTAYLIEAVKELKAEIDILKAA